MLHYRLGEKYQKGLNMGQFNITFKTAAGDTIYETTKDLHVFMGVNEFERRLVHAIAALKEKKPTAEDQWDTLRIGENEITRAAYNKIQKWRDTDNRRELNDYLMGGGIKKDCPNF